MGIFLLKWRTINVMLGAVGERQLLSFPFPISHYFPSVFDKCSIRYYEIFHQYMQFTFNIVFLIKNLLFWLIQFVFHRLGKPRLAHFFNRLYFFRTVLDSQQNWGEGTKLRRFPSYLLHPHTCTASPTMNIPHQSGAFVLWRSLYWHIFITQSP